MRGKHLKGVIIVLAIVLIVLCYEIFGGFLIALPTYVKGIIFISYALVVALLVKWIDYIKGNK